MITTVRFESEPPKTMFARGTRLVFEEMPARTRLEAGLTGSATVNSIASVAVSSATDWLARAVMVGKTIGPRATMRKPVVALPLAGFPLPRKSERMS